MTTEKAADISDATLTAAGIARLAGVGRAAVSNWRRRHADFPTPVSGTAASPYFSAREIDEWLRKQGKLHHVGADQWAWRHIETYQPAAHIGDVLGIVGAYLLAQSERPVRGSNLLSPKQVTTRIRAIDRTLAEVVSRALPHQWGAQVSTVLRSVTELAQERDAEEAFEYLHNRYVSSAQSVSSLAGTPDIVAEVMLTLAGTGSTIFDFACGTGSILRTAAQQAVNAGAVAHCYAQEIKGQYALIALLRLWFVQRRAQRAGHLAAPAPIVHVGDSLLADAFADLRADVVVANFPFGIHDWGHDQLVYDPRWTYGLPPRTEPELAWVQHALAHVTPGGTVVVLMPPAAAGRPAGRRIRAELVRGGALRAVITLPVGLMPPAGIGLHIWVLTKPEPDNTNDLQILFVDASAAGPLAELIRTVWHEFRSGRDVASPGVHRVVAAIELLDDQIDLTPRRHLPRPDEQPGDPAQVLARLDDLDRLLTEVRTALPAIRPANAEAPQAAPRASLADLIKAGSLSVQHSASLRLRASRSHGSQDAVGSSPFHVDPGNPPSGHDIKDGQPASRIRPGDILVSTAGRDVIARVAVTDQVGTELEPTTQLIRVDPTRFDPWFVAGALSQSEKARTGSRATSTGALRIDLRRYAIPVLSLPEQREYGHAFRRLTAFETSLESVKDLGTTLVREIRAGLTNGALAPDEG